MNSKKNRMNSFFAFAILSILSISFFSCKNEIRINIEEDSISFSYGTIFGSAFLDLISAFSQFSENSLETSLFNPEEIRSSFEDSGFKNVTASCPSKNSFLVNGKITKNSQDPISSSGILQESPNSQQNAGTLNLPQNKNELNSLQESKEKVSFVLSKQTLTALQETLPSELQNILDLLMAPTFTGETISDSEYIATVAEVYGEGIAKEIAESYVVFTISSKETKPFTSTISLIRLLNLTETITLKP